MLWEAIGPMAAALFKGGLVSLAVGVCAFAFGFWAGKRAGQWG